MKQSLYTTVLSSIRRPPSGAAIGLATARTIAALTALAAIGFAVHAASYLYFFVDDEAIPFVYARNLLRGRGLSYDSFEGRVEGYSDFLHVIWDAVLLLIAQRMHLPPLTVLDVGTATSFVLGIATVGVAGRLLYRSGVTPAAAAAGLGLIALSGPLALWSCSSLEAVPFAFVTTSLAVALFAGRPAVQPAAPVLLAVLALLMRIDGFVHVGALLLAALVTVDTGDRRRLVSRVMVPIAGAAVLYHAARYAYFGTLLSAPLQAKVLHKLLPATRVLVKAPPEGYLHSFVDLYGVAIVPLALLAAIAAWWTPIARAATVAAALMLLYASLVGDWMFGWRFLAPTIPLIALVVAAAVSRLRGWLAWPAVVLVLAWSGVGARAFAHDYTATEHRPLWWRSPHLGAQVWLAPYGDLLSIAGPLITPGEAIAYNQAGLLAFVLDVDNVDDLGICSKFVAGLPATDVYFTEVGRYSPLTNAPVFGAAHAYLLYRDVRLLISRTDLLRGANGDQIPRELLGGYFRLRGMDASEANAIYVRSDKDASAFRRDPSLFRENLAHFSRIVRADLNGRRLSDERIGPELRFLRWLPAALPVDPSMRLDLRFAEHDQPVYGLYAGTLSARGEPVSVVFNLYDEAGRLVATQPAEAETTRKAFLRVLGQPVRARLLSIEAHSHGTPSRLEISDLRVDGQSQALRDYVVKTLPFTAR